MLDLLIFLLNYPIIITENGVADHKDHIRKEFIQKYMYAISKSIEDGNNVAGYFYWSLMDNFEWAEGYCKKFGLIGIDFESLERIPKQSFWRYQEIIKSS